jgi:aspartate ammonia-lyase
MCTALAPKVGYDKAAEIAKEAYATGKTVRQVALDKKSFRKRTGNPIGRPRHDRARHDPRRGGRITSGSSGYIF